VIDCEVQLEGHEEVADGTMAFRFARPAGFAFRAGQSVDVSLLAPPAEPNSTRRIFSLASAPFEGHLGIATRMRDGSAFKRALRALAPRARLRLKGPLGTMTLHEDRNRAAVFIAGGIGITPFVSMLRQAAHERLPRTLRLLYSNRRPRDAAFLGELQALERQLGDFRLLATMTDADASAGEWHGARGMIDEGLLRRLVADAPSPVYYVAGPPAMVAVMSGVLRRSGVRDEDARSEEFYGY